MKKQTIKLNESQLRNIIKESIKKVLKENTGSLDDLILYARNDRKIDDALYLVKSALLKKVKSGVTPDRNQLADSSTLRKIQQFAIKNYSKEIIAICVPLTILLFVYMFLRNFWWCLAKAEFEGDT